MIVTEKKNILVYTLQHCINIFFCFLDQIESTSHHRPRNSPVPFVWSWFSPVLRECPEWKSDQCCLCLFCSLSLWSVWSVYAVSFSTSWWNTLLLHFTGLNLLSAEHISSLESSPPTVFLDLFRSGLFLTLCL